MHPSSPSEYVTASRQMFRFDGKVAIVTGAAAGIGQATAIGLGVRGARVVLADIDEKGLVFTAGQIRRAGGEASAVVGDLTQEDVATQVADEALSSFGGIDILINNVGGSMAGHTWEFALEDWTKVFARNLESGFLCSRAVIPHMRERRSGRIICVSSGASQGTPWTAYYKGGAAYASAKAGVEGFVRHLALELAETGITVNAVAPGPIETERLKPTFARLAELEYGPLKVVPLRRLGTPWEVASAILFVASDEASYITGQTLSVTGGR